MSKQYIVLAILAVALILTGCPKKQSFVQRAEQAAVEVGGANLCGGGEHQGPKEMDYNIKQGEREGSQESSNSSHKRSWTRDGKDPVKRKRGGSTSHRVTSTRQNARSYTLQRSGTCTLPE